MSILVIGDIMLDITITGSVNRISPEAPIPVFEQETILHKLGGAGKVTELFSLFTDLDVTLIGGVGNDEAKHTVLSELSKLRGVGYAPVERILSRPTTVKTRYSDAKTKTQLFRNDVEITAPFPLSFYENKISYLEHNIKKYKAVVVSDYEKGVMQPIFIETLIRLCNNNNIPLFVDPKYKNIQYYCDATVIKMNRHELLSYLGKFYSNKSIEECMREVLTTLRCKHLVVTNGQHWIATLSSEGDTTTEYTKNINYYEPVDCCPINTIGAGDAFMVGLVDQYLKNKDILTCVKEANLFTIEYLKRKIV